MENHVIYRWSLNTKLFGLLNNVTWIMMLLGLQVVITKVRKDTKWCLWKYKDLQRKDQESSWPNDYTKRVSCWRQSSFLSFTFETFSRKLRSCWIGPFVIFNVFPYGTVKITSLETNKVLKVNGHRLKIFYKGWTT
jgi:hypothetical protein